MYQPRTKNFIYFSNQEQQGKSDSESLSETQLQKILETLSKQALKEKKPNIEELEAILQNSIQDSKNGQLDSNSEIQTEKDSSISLTKLLQEKGYLKDENRWLTKKGFFAISQKILQDVMKNLNPNEYGLHETKFLGNGNVIIDSTKKFEIGNDLKFLSVPQTLLNSIHRLSKTHSKLNFPISIATNDLEEFETLDDVRTAVVYCIDLSSTMKYSLGKNGSPRIVAAKKALWSIYALNKKFFPNDSIYVVGFASLASLVNPFDIPFLRTYDANDNFLHYTNYQSAFRMARKILEKDSSQNKRIVLITDGQPSACFVENDYQKNEIISEKPYSNFYSPDKSVIEKIKNEKNISLETQSEKLIYLCYRYKKVDPKINKRTLIEAKKCKKEGIEIDSIVVSDEHELLNYITEFEKVLKGKTYHISDANMELVLVSDYFSNTRKVFSSNQTW